MDETLSRELSDSERIRAGALPPGPRRIEWAEARRLEREARAALGPEPGAMLSISHTTGIVLVLGALWKAPGPLGLGIDVELLDRAITDRVSNRIADSSERALFPTLTDLNLWVIKEACFKANPDNEGTVVAQYRVIAFDSGTGEGRVEGPGGKTTFLVGDYEPRWRIAVAVVRRKI